MCAWVAGVQGAAQYLYVGVYALILEATGPKVYDFDVAFVRLLQQNVLGLQVAVDDLPRSITHRTPGECRLQARSLPFPA
jgi:hypothetical protein